MISLCANETGTKGLSEESESLELGSAADDDPACCCDEEEGYEDDDDVAASNGGDDEEGRAGRLPLPIEHPSPSPDTDRGMWLMGPDREEGVEPIAEQQEVKRQIRKSQNPRKERMQMDPEREPEPQ